MGDPVAIPTVVPLAASAARRLMYGAIADGSVIDEALRSICDEIEREARLGHGSKLVKCPSAILDHVEAALIQAGYSVPETYYGELGGMLRVRWI